MRGSPLAPAQTLELIDLLASYSRRPVAFAADMFPWGEGELAGHAGLFDWQNGILQDIEDGVLNASEAIQLATASGHDIGKSALVAIIILWSISTFEDTKGVVTANTESQLKSKTWAELAKWYNLFLGKWLFKLTATRICSVDPAREHTWFIDRIAWSEDNPEAFAGFHNKGKRLLILFDEASGIADVIWETIEGATLDSNTEIIWAVFGNPTKNAGRFFECFHKFKHRWHTRKIDSRDVPIANKTKIAQWEVDWSVDSDFFKVRVLGEFPDVSFTQLISRASVEAARKRDPQSFYIDPFVLGVDVARFGTNESVIVGRRGLDARSFPAQRFRGLATTDLGDKVIAIMAREQPDAVFIDEGGVGGGVVDYIRKMGYSVYGVNFGSSPVEHPEGIKVANRRAEMYVRLRTWINGAASIENNQDLEDQVLAVAYGHQKKSQAIILEDKDSMDISPDWADALALTFALPVVAKGSRLGGFLHQSEYDPMNSNLDKGYVGWMGSEAA